MATVIKLIDDDIKFNLTFSIYFILLYSEKQDKKYKKQDKDIYL